MAITLELWPRKEPPMLQIGYKLSSEEHGPGDLVRSARMAEDCGFSFALISDQEVGLPLLPVAQDLDPARVGQELLVEVEDVPVGVALAEDRHETEDPGLEPEPRTVGGDQSRVASVPRTRFMLPSTRLSWGKAVAVLTDARFSGVSTGACIGHVGPEALAAGPIGKLIEGDVIEIIVDRNRLDGSINLIGHGEWVFGVDEGTLTLAGRPPRPDLSPDPDLPDDTRLWAALQQAGGGTWAGCVYDVDAITEALKRR